MIKHSRCRPVTTISAALGGVMLVSLLSACVGGTLEAGATSSVSASPSPSSSAAAAGAPTVTGGPSATPATAEPGAPEQSQPGTPAQAPIAPAQDDRTAQVRQACSDLDAAMRQGTNDWAGVRSRAAAAAQDAATADSRWSATATDMASLASAPTLTNSSTSQEVNSYFSAVSAVIADCKTAGVELPES